MGEGSSRPSAPLARLGPMNWSRRQLSAVSTSLIRPTITRRVRAKKFGQSLKDLNITRPDVVIATKVYNRVGPERNDIGASRGHIMDGVEASLRRLQTDHIDLINLYGP